MSALLKPVPSGRPTFLDVPRCPDLDALDADVAVVGVPFGMPYDVLRSTLCSTAPAAIREQSMRYVPRYLSHYDVDFGGDLFAGRAVKIVDVGDVVTSASTFADNHRRTTEVIRRILARGAVPVTLGGEHSIPIPVMRAFEGASRMHVVHIDAHLDWRDELDGVREGLSSPLRRASEMPWVSGMTQIGLRGFGSARREEFEAARAWGSQLVGAQELHRVGIEEILRRIPAGERYYLTVDADGLDPAIAPGVAGPAPGGVTYWQASNLIRGLAARGKVVGYDYVEVVPSADVGGTTSLLGARLILDLIGALCHAGQIGR